MRQRIGISLVAILLAIPAGGAAADTVLKMATLAPEGSSWMKLFHQWQHTVEARTDGRVRVKFYAGGVQGDEHDVLRKIRLGQLSGAAITAIGLAAIDPEVRALEVARTYEELDRLRAALGEPLVKKFEQKGFVLLGWGDVGPVHLFSQRPIRSMADLQQIKLWLWSDDPVSRQLLDALGVRGVPLGVPDVLPALSTGAVNAFFGSPLSTLALQWSTHTRYMTSLVIGQATGATILAKAAWQSIAAPDRDQILAASHAMESQVLARVRADNRRALETLKTSGLEEVPTPPELARELERRTEAVATRIGQTFSPEFQERVRRLVEQYRASRKRM